MSDDPKVLYTAIYSDATKARSDWDSISVLAKEKTVEFDGLTLVHRDTDGKIDVDTHAKGMAKDTVWGAVGGAVVAIIFPPALLAGAAVGAGIGAGVGALRNHGDKKEVKHDVEAVLPAGSSGIVALFEQSDGLDVEKVLVNADQIIKNEIDADSTEQIKATVSDKQPVATS
jgi:uncharacterized membrane protein